MFERTKRLCLRVANKIFLRSTTYQTHLDIQALRKQVDILTELVCGKLDALEDQNTTLDKRISEAAVDTHARFAEMTTERQSVLLLALENAAKSLNNSIFTSRDRMVDQMESIVADLATSGQMAETTKALNAGIIESRDWTIDRIENIAANFATSGQIAETAKALNAGIIESRDWTVDRIENIAANFATSGQIAETTKALDASIIESREVILRRTRTLLSTIPAVDRMTFRQHEALQGLHKVIGTCQPLPYTRGWAASPDLLLFLHETIRMRKPNLVVEFGSGVTTLIIADALRQNGMGRLRSFDHDTAYATATRANLERNGLADVAEVSCVQLVDWTPPTPTELGDTWQWYEIPKEAQELAGIDLMLVDGPPTKTCAYARYPAAPALIDRMNPGGLILLDDTIRQDETRIAEIWRDQLGLELVFQPNFEKGLGILTLPDTKASPSSTLSS